MRYTKEQHEFMREFIPGHHYKEISEEFFKRFGIEVTVPHVKNYCSNNKISTGFTGRFEKGQEPPNKGKKTTPEQYKILERTFFKKGNEPLNTLPVGTEKDLGDGYISIKVDNKYKAKKQENWKQKHRLIWEEAYGPIPEDCFIIFLDGNKRNFDLENLAMVTKGEHVVMNHLKLRSENPELSKVGIAVAKICIKTGERTKND